MSFLKNWNEKCYHEEVWFLGTCVTSMLLKITIQEYSIGIKKSSYSRGFSSNP